MFYRSWGYPGLGLRPYMAAGIGYPYYGGVGGLCYPYYGCGFGGFGGYGYGGYGGYGYPY